MRHAATRRKNAAEETRQAILAAAKAFYADAANANAPVRHIAKNAGVAEGTVFAHFPDKSALMTAVLEAEITQTLASAWADLPQHAPCREQFLHLARALYGLYAQRAALFRLLLKESLFSQGEGGAQLAAFTYHFIHQVQELIQAAQASGQYRADQDSLLAAQNFFSLYFVHVIIALQDAVFNVDRTLAALTAAIAHYECGLLPECREHAPEPAPLAR